METCYRFHHYRLLPQRRALFAGEGEDQPVKLGGRAFDMLVALVERADRVVGKPELLELVWPGLVVEENNLQVQVLALRKLLGHGAIATVPGRGYRFAVPLSVTGGPAPAPSPAAAAAPAGNMGGCPPVLVGRAEELRALQGLIDKHAVVTITGAGGIGKTRLAQGAAVERAPRQAVWWVELAPLADPALVPAAVGQALGIRVEGQADPTATVVQALQDKSALLVLDNAEHLLDGVAAFVAALRDRARGVKLLVTSQEVMRGLDEQVFRAGPLPLPLGEDLASVQASGAVALFVVRARQADPRFELTEANRAAVADICMRLDGIPLAIELAAARVPLLGVEGLRKRLDERFQVLTAGARAVMRRHQTLRAALDWSHGLLDPPERIVLRRLAVFAGGFTLEAAQAVAADDSIDAWDVLEHLGGLVDKSLVVAEGEALPRYRMLETTRMYALERLAEAGETADYLRAHAEAMATCAEAADAEILAQGQGARALARLDVERDNLLHALDWCGRDTGSDAAALGLRLAAGLRYYWPSRGLIALGLQSMLRALQRSADMPPGAARLKVLAAAAQSASWTGQHDVAGGLIAEQLQLGEALQDRGAQAIAHLALGGREAALGQVEAAERSLRRALALAREAQQPRHIGAALSGLLGLALDRGRLDEARQLADEVIVMRRTGSNKYDLLGALINGAMVCMAQDEPRRSQELLGEASVLVPGTGSSHITALFGDMVALLMVRRALWATGVRLHAACRTQLQAMNLADDALLVRMWDTELSRARAALGDAVFDEQWREGAAMAPDEALVLALAQRQAVAASADAA